MSSHFFIKPAIISWLIVFLCPLAFANNPPVAGFGTSLRFDGVDDFAQINNYPGPTGDFTIEFWVKPTNLTAGWKGFFGYQPGAANTRAGAAKLTSWNC